MFKALAPPVLLTVIVILPLAFILDLAGIILAITGAGELVSLIPDVIGLVAIGSWTYLLSGTYKVTYGAEKRMLGTAKWMKRMRWLRPLLIVFEFIPFVGAAPCWVILVLLELKYSTAQ